MKTQVREIAALSVDSVQFSGLKQDQRGSQRSERSEMGSVILQSTVQTATVYSTDGHSLQYRRPQSIVQKATVYST